MPEPFLINVSIPSFPPSVLSVVMLAITTWLITREVLFIHCYELDSFGYAAEDC